MRIKQAEFIISNTDIKKCPKADMPEYAFIGRSNVGKSSLINMLTERKSLAKVSGFNLYTYQTTSSRITLDKEYLAFF